MASSPVPLIDVEESARVLTEALAQHRSSLGGKLGVPAEGPMFRTAPDGAILSRDGTVVQSAPKVTQPTGA